MERRDFLRTGISSALAISFPGIVTTIPRRAEAAPVNFDLVVEQTIRILSSGPPPVTVPIWRYSNAGAVAGAPGVFQLSVTAGDLVTINIQNKLSVPINFVIPGILETSPQTAAGSMQSYSFVAPPSPGTYVFFDDANGISSRLMGLGGALVVYPADGVPRLYDGGPAFNRDHILLFNEIDTKISLAIANAQPYDFTSYEPNYFFVNGVFYTGGRGVTLNFNKGENVALRMVNTGFNYYSMHFHGWHVNVATRNRVIETAVVEKDTVPVKNGECVEAILAVGNQIGSYPLHTHYLPALTNNGVYLGGSMIMMVAV